jgi:hypothetical protein
MPINPLGAALKSPDFLTGWRRLVEHLERSGYAVARKLNPTRAVRACNSGCPTRQNVVVSCGKHHPARLASLSGTSRICATLRARFSRSGRIVRR